MTFGNISSDSDHNPGFLTAAEHEAIAQAAKLWDTLCAVAEEDVTRSRDLSELAVHIHAIQHAVMANAAARVYPNLYRVMGGPPVPIQEIAV